jgi:metal transporter CNNM
MFELLLDDSDIFFDEDHWYSFGPVKKGDDEKWEVQRMLKSKLLTDTETSNGPNVDGNRRLDENESIVIEGEEEVIEEDEDGSGSNLQDILVHILLSLICVTSAATAAGLTLGMLSIDPVFLEIKRRANVAIPDSPEVRQAELLLPMLVGHTKKHQLLVSLLLLNSLANEALPLFLDELLPNKIVAIIVSVTFVLFFGEIIPSAFFTGPNQIQIAASLVPLAKTVMVILSPIAVPIARLLDVVLHQEGGHEKEEEVEDVVGGGDVTEGNYYNRNELTAMVRIQYESQLAAKRRRKVEHEKMLLSKAASAFGDAAAVERNVSSPKSPSSRPGRRQSIGIHVDEIKMVEGALQLKTKCAADVCTPLSRVYALPDDTILNESVKVQLLAQGYSRVPVYHRREDEVVAGEGGPRVLARKTSYQMEDVSGIVGVLLVRQLIVVDSSEARPISMMELRRPSCISPQMHLVDVINHFQAAGGRGKGGLHLAVVCLHPDVGSTALEKGLPVPEEAGVVGIITLEDVVEELLQEEIYDEADVDYETIRRKAVKKWTKFVHKKRSSRTGLVDMDTETTTEATPLM